MRSEREAEEGQSIGFFFLVWSVRASYCCEPPHSLELKPQLSSRHPLWFFFVRLQPFSNHVFLSSRWTYYFLPSYYTTIKKNPPPLPFLKDGWMFDLWVAEEWIKNKKNSPGISINNGLAFPWQPSRLSAWHTAPPKVSSEFIWSCTQQYSSQCKMPRLCNTSQSGHRATVNQNYNALDVCIRPINYFFFSSPGPVDGARSLLTTESCMCVSVAHCTCACVCCSMRV